MEKVINILQKKYYYVIVILMGLIIISDLVLVLLDYTHTITSLYFLASLMVLTFLYYQFVYLPKTRSKLFIEENDFLNIEAFNKMSLKVQIHYMDTVNQLKNQTDSIMDECLLNTVMCQVSNMEETIEELLKLNDCLLANPKFVYSIDHIAYDLNQVQDLVSRYNHLGQPNLTISHLNNNLSKEIQCALETDPSFKMDNNLICARFASLIN